MGNLFREPDTIVQNEPNIYIPLPDRFSFVTDGKKGRNFWDVVPSEDYGKDCQIGNNLALEYLQNRRECGPNTSGFLQQIVGSMPRDLTGLEIGFFTLISFAAEQGVQEAERLSEYWYGGQAMAQHDKTTDIRNWRNDTAEDCTRKQNRVT